MAEPTEFLRISNLHAWYGESHILHGVDLTVHKGEVVTLLGRNGAGRTTTIKSIVGLVGKRTGSITINGRESIGMAPHQIAKLGIGYCPEERGIFASLSCEENLLLPPEIASGGMPLDEIYEMFPNLKERRNSQGTRLSGGEQQRVAIARALANDPAIILADEPTGNLDPQTADNVFSMFIKLAKERGQSALVATHNMELAKRMDRIIHLESKNLR